MQDNAKQQVMLSTAHYQEALKENIPRDLLTILQQTMPDNFPQPEVDEDVIMIS